MFTISGWRTTCLPWVTYSRKSPTFIDNVVFLLTLLYILNDRAVYLSYKNWYKICFIKQKNIISQRVSALCSNCYIYKAFFAYPLTENSPKYFTEGLSSQNYAHACAISTLTRADISRCVGQAVYFCKVFGDTSVKIIRIWPCALHFYIRGLGHTPGL